jgi:aryl-alcohol dehydrogenase-like predicted oxidoreductase
MDRTERLVLGTADLRDDELTVSLLDRFHAAGGRRLDLANVYGDGEASRGARRWLAQSRKRDDVVLYVKGCHPPFCSPSLVKVEVERARSLLGVDTLDVFMLHRDDASVPIAAFADALREQVDAGTIESFGVSNWMIERFEALAAELGPDAHRLVVFSNHFSLVTMVTPTWPGCLAMTKENIATLERSGVTALAWATLAGGYLAGHDIASWSSPENDERRRRAGELAVERRTTAPSIALAYVLHQPTNVLAAIGTRSEQHLDELVTAARFELSADELAGLENL